MSHRKTSSKASLKKFPSKNISEKTQKCFLVCNAHLDPVWLWSWEEGQTEAISTYRVAADFCDKYPDFVFNHNEALLYEWVERNDPDLFRRIQKHVKSGQWHIAGGSYLQPDMIGSSGEGLIRQFLIGKLYFEKKFGKEPKVAYNFDSFGHSQGFIQILSGCGFDGYVFCRPSASVLPLPQSCFRWRHESGVEIVGRRADEHYITQGELLKKMVDGNWPERRKAEGDFMFLWGLGNHGGGASREEYADLLKLGGHFPHVDFIESNPDDFFKHSIKQHGLENLPVVKGDLKPVMEGCYISMQAVKSRYRHVENLMYVTEKLAALAWWKGKSKHPSEDLTVAWKDILFGQFHDILPGSCIERAERDSLNLLGHAEEILRRKKSEALIALLRNEKLAERNETPIFVFNPHGWEVTREVQIEYGIDRQFSMDQVERHILLNGKEVEAQFEKSEDNLFNDSWGEWRKKAVFITKIPPYSIQRFETDYTVVPKDKIQRWKSPALPSGNVFEIKTKDLKISLNLRTGFIDRVEQNGKATLGADSFRPHVYGDSNHSWATPVEWREPASFFKLATPEQAALIKGSEHVNKDYFPKGKQPIAIIEDGPIRTVIEAILVHGHSYIVQRYIISKHFPSIQIEQVIFWAEHDKQLQLSLAHVPSYHKVEAEKCYSIDDESTHASDGKIRDFQHFLRFSDGGEPYAVVSHGSLAYQWNGSELRLPILRSPSYATHEENISADFDMYHNRYIPRQEQGVRHARFTFLFGSLATDTQTVARASYEYNVPLEAYVYFPTDRKGKRDASSFAKCAAANVIITTIKKSDRGEGLVFRLWETAGKKTTTSLVVQGRKFPVSIGARQIHTFVLGKNGKLSETDMIERPIKQKLLVKKSKK